MFEIKIKIENDLKWIEAIEKLAGCRAAAPVDMETAILEEEAKSAILEPPADYTPAEGPATSETIADREAIKKELATLGIQFNERLRTPTLLEMLEKAKATGGLQPVSYTGICDPVTSEKEPASEPKAADPCSDPAPDAPWEMTEEPPIVVDEKKYTLEDLRSALGKYAVKHGKEKAFQVLKETTGAVKLSEIPVEKYAALMGVIDG